MISPRGLNIRGTMLVVPMMATKKAPGFYPCIIRRHTQSGSTGATPTRSAYYFRGMIQLLLLVACYL